MSYFIVMSSMAKMPRKCGSDYERVAVVEVIAPGTRPRMISARARGVVRIVKAWPPAYRGTTAKCAYARVRQEAEAMALKIDNAGMRRLAKKIIEHSCESGAYWQMCAEAALDLEDG